MQPALKYIQLMECGPVQVGPLLLSPPSHEDAVQLVHEPIHGLGCRFFRNPDPASRGVSQCLMVMNRCCEVEGVLGQPPDLGV